MCHEKYHHDPDLRAVANVLAGLPTATSVQGRQRSQTVAALLLNTCCTVGLLDYLKSSAEHLPSGERHRLMVRVKAIHARQMQEAMNLVYPSDPDDDQPPF